MCSTDYYWEINTKLWIKCDFLFFFNDRKEKKNYFGYLNGVIYTINIIAKLSN